MTGLHPVQDRPVRPAPDSARWAWACIALSPVALVAVVLVGLLLGGGGATPSIWGGAALTVLALGLPTCGVVMAVRSYRDGHASGRASVVVAVVVLVALAVLLPLTAVAAKGAILGAALCAVALAVGLRRPA